MLRNLLHSVIALGLLTCGSVALLLYHNHTASTRQIQQLEEQKQQLQQIVQRLESEKRVADVLVKKKEIVEGVPRLTLLFVEYDKKNQPLPARTFTVTGEQVHFDALVIKFDRGFTEQNDPLRGHSIALFTRVYGDRESPSSAAKIDEPNSVPLIYQTADPRVMQFETSLWRDFWRLAEDANYRAKFGVRVAMGQGVFGPLVPERLYTLTLESTGGLNLTSEPMKGIYREALQQPGAMSRG
jgi:hypothetical protein